MFCRTGQGPLELILLDRLSITASCTAILGYIDHLGCINPRGTVWPDVGIKRSPILSYVAHKVTTVPSVYFRSYVLQNSQIILIL